MLNIFKISRASLSGLAYILLIFIAQIAFADDVQFKLLSNSNEWKTLLYYENKKFIIKDPNFYISKERTLYSELKEFISKIETEKSIICKFPGRYTYLSKVLNYSLNDLESCEELNDFKRRAPLNEAYIVFASENISSPSSMMGHIYLKLEGTNHLQQEVEHAISFFTDVDDYNIPKLIYDALIVGKNGFYALSPNRPMRDKYVHDEGRNVWEYRLKATSYQKELLHNHLYELKKINFKYYFHNFNCATLIDKILNVAYPESYKEEHIWTTPLDVTRDLRKKDIIAETNVFLSNKWKIKALLENYNFDKETLQMIKNKNVKFLSHPAEKESETTYLKAELMSTYYDYKNFSEEKKIVDDFTEKYFSDFKLDLSQYKNPNLTRSTSQILAQYESNSMNNLFKLTWLPASHFIEDDSSNYIYESELQVSRVTLAYDNYRKNIFLDEFNLYSSSSFQATDFLTGGLSGRVKIGYYNYINSELDQKRSIHLQGLVGKTLRLHKDIDSFSMLGASYLEANSVMLAPEIEAGLILRGIFKMKTILSYNYKIENIAKDETLLTFNLKHFIDLNNYGLFFEYTNYKNHNKDHFEKLTAGFKFYF